MGCDILHERISDVLIKSLTLQYDKQYKIEVTGHDVKMFSCQKSMKDELANTVIEMCAHTNIQSTQLTVSAPLPLMQVRDPLSLAPLPMLHNRVPLPIL